MSKLGADLVTLRCVPLTDLKKRDQVLPVQWQNSAEQGCPRSSEINVTIETIHWHTLHPRYLGPESVVLDLGANIGQFAQAIAKRFGCRCVAVEPSPKLFDVIPNIPRISKLQTAVADKSGVMPFHIAPHSVASSLVRAALSDTETIEVPVCSLADLLAQLKLCRVDLLKVDIEGAEIGMFAACPDEILTQIAQISVEFHDFCGITSPVEVTRTLERLHELGF